MTSTATHARATDIEEPGGQPPPERSGLAGLFDLVRDVARRIARSARSTPGRLSGITVLLVVLATVVAVVGAVLVDDREDTIDGLIEHREPLAVAAQELYRALSDADVTVTRSFLSAADQRASLRTRYERDIAEAGTALARAASGTGRSPDAAKQVAILSKQLPVYTGLVEQARASRQQVGAGAPQDGPEPAGAQYLRQASELMRTRVLPAARELYEINTTQLAEEQEEATEFPWALTVLVLVLLAALVAAQVYLRKRTNRVFNVGLLVASGAVVVLLFWGAAAITVQSVLVTSGSASTAQEDQLVRARITALRARADEMFMLLAREDGDRYRTEFAELARQLAGPQGHGGLLLRARAEADQPATAEHIGYAQKAARSWLGVHNVVRQLAESGSYPKAVALAIDARDGGSSTATFARLDRSLAKAIDSARAQFRADTTSASAALTLLTPGVIVLSILAALGATIGLRDRLREYR